MSRPDHRAAVRPRAAVWVAAILAVGLTACTGSTARRTVSAPTPAPPSPALTGAAGKHYVPNPIPSATVALDVSWVTRSVGWLAAAENCGRFQCVVLYRTRDAGQEWSRVRAPRLRLFLSAGVRFVDSRTGYFFSNRLFMTTDGGRHWSHQRIRNVSDVVLVGDAAVALTFSHGGCPGPCDVQVERARVGSGSWSTVLGSSPLAGYSTLSGASGGVVAVQSGNRASASAKGRLATSTDAGWHWTTFGDPCGVAVGRHEYDLVAATAAGATVTVLCGQHVGAGRVFAMTSSDGGRTYGPRAWLPDSEVELLTSLDGDRLVAGDPDNGGGRYRLLLSKDRGRSWRTVFSVSEPVYDTPQQLAGRSELTRSDAAPILTYIADGIHVWRSVDGGRTWQRLRLPGS